MEQTDIDVKIADSKKSILFALNSILLKMRRLNFSTLVCDVELLQDKYPTFSDALKKISDSFQENRLPVFIKRDQIYMQVKKINDLDLLTDLLTAIQSFKNLNGTSP
jgi:hypothetical protein